MANTTSPIDKTEPRSRTARTKRQSLVRFLLGLIDPLNTIPAAVMRRTESDAMRYFDIVATLNFVAWIVVWLSATVLNDRLKPNYLGWFKYRIIFSGWLAILLFAFLQFKDRIRLVAHALVLMLGASLAFAYSWSYGFGQPMPRGFITFIPFLVFSTCYRSFVVSIAFLLCSLIISYSQWHQFNHVAWVFTDFEMAGFSLIFTHFVHTAIITNRSNHYILIDLTKLKAETEQRFYSELLKFISPNLVNSLKRRVLGYSELMAAFDDLLRRKTICTSVSYCDWRDFSKNADSIDFIERQLIPSSAAIIDICESNQGVAKQVGDAILTFYPTEDPEESLLMAVKSTFECLFDQSIRVGGWHDHKRYFIVTFGKAVVGNMASQNHRELTIVGKPANLAARIDELTKVDQIRKSVEEHKAILLDSHAHKIFDSFSDNIIFKKLSLRDLRIEFRSFPDEDYLYLMPFCNENIKIIDELLLVNGHPALKIDRNKFYEKI